MMQKEFEELTGVIVSNSEYASIEREYMSCEDEKRIFCKKWVKNGGAAMLAKNRLAEIERLNAQVLALKNEASALREKLDKAQKWNLVVDSKKTQTEYEEIERDASKRIIFCENSATGAVLVFFLFRTENKNAAAQIMGSSIVFCNSQRV